MNMEADGMDSDFCHWRDLTDEYAEKLEDLRRGKPGALAELQSIARELEKSESDFQSIGKHRWTRRH